MITSVDDLTEIIASMVDRDPEINNQINEFFNKAYSQLSGVNIHEWNDTIGIPLDEAFLHFAQQLDMGRNSKNWFRHQRYNFEFSNPAIWNISDCKKRH